MTLMTHLATAALSLHGQVTGRVEAITYTAKATPGSATVTHTVQRAVIQGYRLGQLIPELILATDRECLLATHLATWTPSDYDEVTRADSTVWRVQSVQDGPGHPFYRLQLRQIG